MTLAFSEPVDIANHALQLLGVDSITASSFQSPDSKAARETSRCYDKLRTAELRRNTWRFATKRAILRAITPATVLWTPPAYSSSLLPTYDYGQIVAYQGDYYDVNTSTDGLTVATGTVTFNNGFFNSGDTLTINGAVITFLAPGSNTAGYEYYVFIVSPPTFEGSIGAQLEALTLPGAVIFGGPGAFTITIVAAVPGPAGNAVTLATSSANFILSGPTLTGGGDNGSGILLGSKYFGPITCDPFDTSGATSYFAGEITVVPETWLPEYPYEANTIIAYENAGQTLFYVSLQPAFDQVPGSSPTYWQPFAMTPGNTPPLGPYVYSSFNGGPVVWLCATTQTNVTPGNPPAMPSAPGWVPQGGTVTGLQIVYPLGTGPGWEVTSRNIFRLPYGYLKKCPTNPKGQLTPPVGGPAYNQEDDYLIEGSYINSSQPSPILLRFVADIIDVSEMDVMFCRGLAASMALQCCEALTQANDKKADARLEYKVAMGEARTVNGIETGTVDPVEDEYIMARL